MQKLEIGSLAVVSMEAGGVIIRIDGQGYDSESKHLTITDAIKFNGWLDDYLSRNREFKDNTMKATAALNRTKKLKKVVVKDDPKSK